jgi:hypothetical protein
MSDRLDEMLSRMPSEPLPSDLIVRVQARLDTRRRVDLWRLWAGQLVLTASAVAGAWLLAQSSNVGSWQPNLSVDALLRWLSGVAASPQAATLDAASGAVAWGDWLSGQMNLPVLLALILLAAPATALLIALLQEPVGRRGAIA